MTTSNSYLTNEMNNDKDNQFETTHIFTVPDKTHLQQSIDHNNLTDDTYLRHRLEKGEQRDPHIRTNNCSSSLINLNTTQSISPVPTAVGIGNISVMVTTAVGTVGQGVPQASASYELPFEDPTVASSPFPDERSNVTRTASTSSSSTESITACESKNVIALQWNIRGLRANISELKHLIFKLKPCVVALQETKTNRPIISPEFISRNYSLLLNSNRTHHWQHGIGLAVREGISFERIQLNTTLQVVAVRIFVPVVATVISIYIPPSSVQCQTAFSELLEQLEGPVLLLGDFNAHHPAWGSQSWDTLGEFIANISLTKQLVILNNGSPTRIDPSTGKTSAIDITLCSES